MPDLGEDHDFSELRKGERADANVTAWFADVSDEEIFLSVLTIDEFRRGIENVRRRDPGSAAALDRWLALVREAYSAGYGGIKADRGEGTAYDFRAGNLAG